MKLTPLNRSLLALGVIVVALTTTGPVLAQTAELPHRVETYAWNSGIFNGASTTIKLKWVASK